ncbi:MAG TPA: FAD-dependent oxidoreductase [Ktedonobacteraceae bacterium]
MPSVAIIGAGCSGLAAAHELRDAGYAVTIFEQNKEVGGRAASRDQQGFIYDYGAQYIKSGSSVSIDLITRLFKLADLVDISKPVWIFDRNGYIQEGDPIQNAEPKWNYRSGINALAKCMAQGLDIRLQTRIVYLQQSTTGWRVFGNPGYYIGEFDRVLITIPASEAAELIKNSQIQDIRQEEICALLEKAKYNPLISVMLGYRPLTQKRPYYALVNTDKAHVISWLAWEHEKAPERVPEGAGLLIAQMAPQYSQDNWHKPDAELIDDVANRIAVLLNEPLNKPIFSDIYRWRYALPAEKADAEQLNTKTLPVGLAFCGDAFVGGRVHLALEHGVEVARQLLGRSKES